MARRPKSVPDRILDAAARLAADRPWNAIPLVDIAVEAAVTPGALHAAYRSKAAIVAGLMARASARVMDGTDPTTMDEPARERLFDAVMRRLDALRPWKSAIRSMARGAACDPVQALCLTPAFHSAIATTLESAGIAASGLAGNIRVKALGAIYLATLCVWLGDDSEDLGKTMAFLDRRLRTAERFAALLPDVRRAGAGARDGAA